MTWTDPTTKKEYSYTWGFDHIKAPDIFEKENNTMNIYDLANCINNDCKLIFGDKSIPVRVDSIDSSFSNVGECNIKCTVIQPKFEYVPYSNMYRNRDRKSSPAFPSIKKVIFNDPATIILWSDNTKTIIKCGENDWYDPEKGMAMAIAKKALGNEGNYYETFKKWLKDYEVKPGSDMDMLYPSIFIKDINYDEFRDFLNNQIMSIAGGVESEINKEPIPDSDRVYETDNEPKMTNPKKKPKWKIHWSWVNENESFVYSYAYSTKYSAERAARRMFGENADLATWHVEEEEV